MRGRAWVGGWLLAGAVIAAACGGSELGSGSAASGDGGTTDAIAGADGSLAESAAKACVAGQSVACVGIGGCSSSQSCKDDGTGYGPCTCAPPVDATTTACVPGASVACSGPGGCISSQVCDATGTGYGACTCTGDAGTLLCVPGQSIGCGGPFGCVGYQVCNASGDGYSVCDCPDALSYVNDAGDWPDGWAHLPPPVGDQGYNAIWSEALQEIFLPLFSAPDCTVVPPYGSFYGVTFRPAYTGTGPSGTFTACYGNDPPCYAPTLNDTGSYDDEPGMSYTLSGFVDGIATGQMDTNQGVVPLVVKDCPGGAPGIDAAIAHGP